MDLDALFFKVPNSFDRVIEDITEEAGQVAVLDIREITDESRDDDLRILQRAELRVDYESIVLLSERMTLPIDSISGNSL